MNEPLEIALRRTPLFAEHVALGARLVPFGGFEMPVQYAGILKEHEAVRRHAGLFDLSHMAQFELQGAGVPAWADELTVNAVATMKPGQARYNIFTNTHGGCHDDVLFYRLADRFLLVVNAGNAAKMWSYLNDNVSSKHDVQLTSYHGSRALVAVQGPRAVEIVAALADSDISVMKYYTCVAARVAGVPALVARTGYTGEDGYELFVDGEDATRVWRTLLRSGAASGLVPAGLGARDVLRLEAGMPLYGHELAEDVSPLAGGQGWAVKTEKAAFIGRDALLDELARDDYDRIAGIVLDGRVPARTGYPVFLGDEHVGEVRSATVAPAVGNKNVATALVRKAATAAGTALAVEIRGKRHAATVVPLPFYKRST